MPTTPRRVEDVEVTLHTGERTRLSALAAGGPLVVTSYPKAFTRGCTAQTCHLRDLAAEFAELGARRVAISRDDVATQARFAAEHALDYPLIADTDGSVSRVLGTRRPGPLWNRRRTVVVDRDLAVLGVVDGELDAERHADEALALLRARRG